MNRHLTEGELRAFLDNELDAALSGHLNACAVCQKELNEVKQAHLRSAKRLSFLSGEIRAVPSAQSAWYRFTQDYVNKKETSMLKKWFSFPVVRYGAIALVALALLLAFPSTRALASEFLNLFRVQQVTVLSIDPTSLESLTGNEALGTQLSELVSSSTVVTDEPGEPVEAANGEEASGLAGFSVRLPEDQTASGIYVTDSAAFTLTVDREKAQALIDGAGRTDLILPEAINGAEISVSIPATVSASFGTCPDPDIEGGEDPIDMGEMYPDCTVLTQMTSPVVNVPEGVDMAQLAQIALEFSGMSSEEAASFASSVDWATTLVVPIPRDVTTHSEVSVDGVTGILIQRTAENSPEYVLMWVKDGILYAIADAGADTAPAFALAESLP
ncbi:MAG: hypothetical protein JNK32_06605 [Anaerolineales bacterium]|nr:hypothetical protein [Anaerolineales bacterium]